MWTKSSPAVKENQTSLALRSYFMQVLHHLESSKCFGIVTFLKSQLFKDFAVLLCSFGECGCPSIFCHTMNS